MLANQTNAQILISTITTRRSTKSIVAPGPSAEQLELSFTAAMHAPDHAALRLWRFVTVSVPHVEALGELAIAANLRAGLPMSDEKAASIRRWLKKVPLLIGLAYQMHHDHPKVNALEQSLSMGAAVMNLQNSLHAMGFGTFWSTGLGTYTDEVPAALGFDTLDYQFVGFLSVGTIQGELAPAVKRPQPSEIVHAWVPNV
jgi:nitroreductase